MIDEIYDSVERIINNLIELSPFPIWEYNNHNSKNNTKNSSCISKLQNNESADGADRKEVRQLRLDNKEWRHQYNQS